MDTTGGTSSEAFVIHEPHPPVQHARACAECPYDPSADWCQTCAFIANRAPLRALAFGETQDDETVVRPAGGDADFSVVDHIPPDEVHAPDTNGSGAADPARVVTARSVGACPAAASDGAAVAATTAAATSAMTRWGERAGVAPVRMRIANSTA